MKLRRFLFLLLVLSAFAKVKNHFDITRGPQLAPPAPTATRTAVPHPTARPTKTPTPTPLARDCAWWYELRKFDVGDNMCVQGFVSQITGNTADAGATRIYFQSNSPERYEWSDWIPSEFYFIDQSHYYPDLVEEICVSATGTVSINRQGVMFMRIDSLEVC